MASGVIREKGLKKIQVVNDTISGNGFATRQFLDTVYPNANFVGCISKNPDYSARIIRLSANTGYSVQCVRYDGAFPVNGTVVTYDVFYYEN